MRTEIMFETARSTSLTIVIEIVVGRCNSMVYKQKKSEQIKTAAHRR
jgi:hypothetical protein